MALTQPWYKGGIYDSTSSPGDAYLITYLEDIWVACVQNTEAGREFYSLAVLTTNDDERLVHLKGMNVKEQCGRE